MLTRGRKRQMNVTKVFPLLFDSDLTLNLSFCSTQMCMNEELSKKTIFPTFARTIPPISRLAPQIHALLKHFNWTRVGIITQQKQQRTQWGVLEDSLRRLGVRVSSAFTMDQGEETQNLENGLQKTSQLSRGIAPSARLL